MNPNQELQEAINLFLQSHPELTISTSNVLQMLITAEKKTYSVMGIEFGINYAKEQLALKKESKD